MISMDPNERLMQDSSWADGLRGIAALYVAASHLVLCFGRQFIPPCCADDETRTPWLFQRPILRLIASGHSWVAVFFVLLGFVNALKPIKQARSGDADSALLGLSTAAFRRSFRLVLPAATSTIIAWFLCQFGAFEIARNSDAWWLYDNTPEPSESWAAAVVDLVANLMNTWRIGGKSNIYDQPQWALIYLLLGSMMTFFVLLATVQLTPLWRTVTITLCMLWSWSWSHELRDPMVGYATLGGILLAEFSVLPSLVKVINLPLVSGELSPILAVIALIFMSYPSGNVDAAPWSNYMKSFFQTLFPESVHYTLDRVAGTTGALLLCFAIIISPTLRRPFSAKPLRWLGKISFPIYLLHGTVMKTVLAWFVFAGQPLEAFPLDPPEGGRNTVYRYAQPGAIRIMLGIVLMGAVTLYASHLWANNFEPAFGKITAWAENKMKRPDDGPMLLLTHAHARGSRGSRSPRSPRSPMDRSDKQG